MAITKPAGKRVPFAVLTVGNYNSLLIGRITLRNIDEPNKTARIGVYIHPSWTGRGYGTNLLRAFGRNWTLHADVADDNQQAIKCYGKAGFHQANEYHFDGHRYLDMVRIGADSNESR